MGCFSRRIAAHVSSNMRLNKYSVAKALIGVGLLVWLVTSGQLDFSVLVSAPVNTFHLLGLFALLTGMILRAVRWWWLLRMQNIALSLRHSVELTWISQFFCLVLPGAAAGELVRAYYIARDTTAAKVASFSTILLDRLIGLYALLWLGIPPLLVLILSQNEVAPIVIRVGTLLSLTVACASVMLIAFWRRSTRQMILRLVPKRFRAPLEAVLEAYRDYGRDLIGCFGLSLLANAMLVGAFLLASRILDTPLGWQQVFLVAPFVIAANSLPISPGGVGVAETTAAILFAQFGVETGAAIMLIVRLWTLILRLPGGLIYILHTRGAALARPDEGADPQSKLARSFR